MNDTDLIAIANKIATKGKGILAADESTGTIKKRFDVIQVESNADNHRAYRNLLFTTPSISDYISGVILFDETFYQKTNDGVLFPEYLTSQGILAGIKVDAGLIPLALSDNEQTTQGLDALPQRLETYKKGGATFAKWRCVFTISDVKPSANALAANAELLARYAAICQTQGIVPIVEPEVLITGDHTIERCAAVITKTLTAVFNALRVHNVLLEGMVLKPSMVTSGDTCKKQATIDEVAKLTIQVLKRCVPAAVPTINFLSGGQSPDEATVNLNAMHQHGELPWNLSFSYGRALQQPCLEAWLGKKENVDAAQAALLARMQANSAASLGEYKT